MNDAVSPPAARILSTSLHHLDLEAQTCNAVPMPVEREDLERYLTELLSEINGRPQNRAYVLASPTTEFATSLRAFFENQDLVTNPHTQALANRLLRIELATEERYGHLDTSGTGHVKKGSFLQFLYLDGPSVAYLGVKIEHQRFLDETDLRRKIGLGESHKIYKACKSTFDSNGSNQQALVFDTNSRPSTYWWKEVLELKQLRTDTFNTETAVKSVIRVIGKIKNTSAPDYTILRNATIAAFKQSGQINFDDFVTTTFSQYAPVNHELIDQLPEIVEKLRELPEKRQFDGHFTLIPSAVPYRRQTVNLSDEISVSYNEGITNLSDKIWSSRTPDGKSVLVIDAPNSTDNFTQKPWSAA
ncbi:nucleoid-associated protein [Pseudomonas sp. MOB-449]|nr:nucleoid-associated protein [Pseudomonas sp. MOB-449]